MSDEHLIARIGAGDRGALRAIYVRYKRRVTQFVLRFTDDPADAEEVVNDVFLAVWKAAESFQGRARGSTWLLGIAYRQALKRVRAGRAASRVVRQDEAPREADLATQACEAPGPRQVVEGEQLLQRALAALPPEQRLVVELTFVLGCSYQEIAEIAGCPVGTVKTRMFHARRHMRAAVEPLQWPAPRHATEAALRSGEGL